MKLLVCLVILCCSAVMSQRSPYAGARPAGSFDQFLPSTTTRNPQAGNRNELETAQETNTQKLPLEVNGDLGYYHYLLSLPKDKQPYWLLNHQQIEAHKNQPNPQIAPLSSRSHFAGVRR